MASLSPVQPSLNRSWDRYRIEGDKITIGDETFDLFGGKRRIIRASDNGLDNCYDNVKWAAETAQ